MKKVTLSCLSLALALATSACSTHQETITHSSDWQSITFGQSTDANFATNVLKDKVGVNFTYLPSGLKALPQQAQPLAFPITVESRGGKIGNSHDGLTYYYTTIDSSKNFVLEALVRIDQFGPENGAKPAAQEGCGLLVRDILGPARNEQVVPGIEEFPASSNMVMTAVMTHDKSNHTNVDIMQLDRNGVLYPWGNQNIAMQRRNVAQNINLEQNNTFILRLERTNEGFVSSYAPQGSKEFISLNTSYPQRVQKLDNDKYYVGFFSSRNARMTVLDATLTTSDANLIDLNYQAPSEETYLELNSAPIINKNDQQYTFSARTNSDGLLALSSQEPPIAVKAGELINIKLPLNNSERTISYTFTPNNHEQKALTGKFNLTDNYLLGSTTLYASAHGNAQGKGTKNSPLDVATALKLVKDGGVVYLLDGQYDLTTLDSQCSGSPAGLKTLQGSNKVVFHGLNVAASYLKLIGFNVTTKPLNVSGSYNHLSFINAYACDDTGIWVASPKEVGRALWASHNLIEDCTSHENQDPGNINADGFAVKMRVGEGNRIVRALSWGNADDGYDLFNKIEDGPNGAVKIEDSVAMFNNNNGFKLGGEGLPVAHSIDGSIAYRNGMDGFTDNFNPGAITVSNNVSIDNQRFNYIFRHGPFVKSPQEQGHFTNNLSLRSTDGIYGDVVNGNIENNNSFLLTPNKDTQGYKVNNHTKGEVPKRQSDGSLPAQFFFKENK